MSNRARKCQSGQNRSVQIEALESRKLLAGTISGTVFNDRNLDGIQGRKDVGVAKQRVYLDNDFDGVRDTNEPLLTTDTKGNFLFKNVAAGVTRVHVLPSRDYRLSTVSNPYNDVTVTDGQNSSTKFGITSTAVITGVAFKDLNQDGIKQLAEGTYSNVSVFIDLNGNKHWDTNEPKSKTEGPGLQYRFDGLAPGTYTVRVIVPSVLQLTAGQSLFKKVTLEKGTIAGNRNWGFILK